MREYTTLTREAVDVVEGAAQYMSTAASPTISKS